MLLKSNYQEHYIPIARKYRPAFFNDIIGQSLIVTTLINSINSMRIPQALLFTGIRGVGKTTIARIIAKALNCSKYTQPTADFCNQCEQCKSISLSSNPDVFEMDAASHTGVDDIRFITDNIQYRPILGRFKIYIIDEIHMLSNNAFNALLKTLEEPPLHLKFIFATTETRKIPKTVLSRCQRFNLWRIPQKLLQEYFLEITKREGYIIDKNALEIIAEAADGSVRDGLSILDQAMTLATDKSISKLMILEMLGVHHNNEILTLFETIVLCNVQGAIEQLNLMYFQGIEPITIIHDILKIIYHLMKIYSLNKNSVAVDSIISSQLYFNEFNAFEFIKKIELTIPKIHNIKEFVFSGWDIIISSLEEINTTNQQWLTAEVMVLKLINLIYGSNDDSRSAQDNLSSQKNKIKLQNADKDSVIKTDNALNSCDVISLNSNDFNAADTKNEEKTDKELNKNQNNINEILLIKKSDILQAAGYLLKISLDNEELMLYHWLLNDIYILSLKLGYIKIKLKKDTLLNNKQQFAQFKSSLEHITNIQWNIDISRDQINSDDFTISALQEEDKKNKKLSIMNDDFIKEAISAMEVLEIDKIELHK